MRNGRGVGTGTSLVHAKRRAKSTHRELGAPIRRQGLEVGGANTCWSRLAFESIDRLFHVLGIAAIVGLAVELTFAQCLQHLAGTRQF